VWLSWRGGSWGLEGFDALSSSASVLMDSKVDIESACRCRRLSHRCTIGDTVRTSETDLESLMNEETNLGVFPCEKMTNLPCGE